VERGFSKMSAYSMDPTLVDTMKAIVGMLKADPSMLESPDLGFFRDYLASLGAKVPEREQITTQSLESTWGCGLLELKF
jgi:suppressor of tumorigenicity protein 13